METLKNIPKWAEQALFPKLNTIEGELKAIHARIDATNVKIDQMDKRLTSNMDSMKSELRAELRTLDTKVDVLPRVAVIEAEITALKKRR